MAASVRLPRDTGLRPSRTWASRIWPSRIWSGLADLAAGCAARLPLGRSRQPQIDAEAVLASIGGLVTWHDRTGAVLRVSPTTKSFAGTHPEALYGLGLFHRVHVADRPGFLRTLSDAAHGGAAITTEFRLHVGGEAPADGHVLWVEMRAQAMGGRKRRDPAAVLAVLRDVTSRRAQDEELRDAKQAAERANELKGRFLATVTHELRTPLNAIIGFSELMAMNHPYVLTGERRMEYATIIRSSGHHLLDVVNTLLDMSKIETGNFPFEPEAFSLGELVDGCCDLMQLKAEGAGVTIHRDVQRGLPDVVADRRACRQILINLVGNAVKFTPVDGSVTVTVRREGDHVTMAVADTGIGIGEGDLPRLGDPFFQAGDAYRRPHEGTGLGLSVVRGLLGLHHGSLSVESATGMGTTVTATLPLDGSLAPPISVPVGVRTHVRRVPPACLPQRLSA